VTEVKEGGEATGQDTSCPNVGATGGDGDKAKSNTKKPTDKQVK